MKTIQQDLKSSDLNMDDAVDLAHSGDWCLRLALCTLSGACQK